MKREKRRFYEKLHRERYQELGEDGKPVQTYDPKTRAKTKRNKRSHLFVLEGQWRYPSYGNAVWHPYVKTSRLELEDTVTYGPNIPGWRDKLRHGVGVVTSLEGVRQTVKVDYGGVAASGPLPTQFNQNGSEDALIGSFGGYYLSAYMPGPTKTTSATAEQKARSNLLQSYLKETQSFSGGKFVAELKDSIDLVLHPVRSVYRKTWEFAGRVKRIGRIYQHRPRTAAAALSESWLAFSFGVKPFLQDANDASTALNRLVQNPRDNLRYVQGTGHDRTFSSRNVTLPGAGGVIVPMAVSTATDLSVRLAGAFRQEPTGTGNLLKEFGFDVFDIAPSIWEGIPWSFFVDYFMNVGECLDAWRLLSVDQAWLIRTVRNRSTVSLRTTYKEDIQDRSYNAIGGDATGTTTYVHRTETAFFSETPSFHFKLPGTNPSRLLNIVSLIGVINDSRWGSRPKLSNAVTG